jgi:hypothetical protein
MTDKQMTDKEEFLISLIYRSLFYQKNEKLGKAVTPKEASDFLCLWIRAYFGVNNLQMKKTKLLGKDAWTVSRKTKTEH